MENTCSGRVYEISNVGDRYKTACGGDIYVLNYRKFKYCPVCGREIEHYPKKKKKAQVRNRVSN